MSEGINGYYDSADQDAVDQAARDARRRENEDRETVRIWMSHEKGRDFLFRIVFDLCHLGETFTAVDSEGRSDPLRTYLHLGERNIGAWLDNKMREHPKLYTAMLQEQHVAEELRNDRLRKQNRPEDQDEHDAARSS